MTPEQKAALDATAAERQSNLEPLPQGASEAAPAIETKEYSDGTTATGVAPLPDQSPAQQQEQEQTNG